jgi:hypothetical protein
LISQNLGPFLKSKGVEAIIEIDDKWIKFSLMESKETVQNLPMDLMIRVL